MRHILTLLCAISLLTTSCSKSECVDTITPTRALEFFVDFDNQTRIEFTSESSYRWQGDETLGVYVTAAEPTVNIPAYLTFADGKAMCRIVAKIYADGDTMYSYYPWSEQNDMQNISTLTLCLPQQQKQERAGKFVVTNMPMVSTPYTLNSEELTPTVYMRPLAGFLRANVYASSDVNSGESVLSVSYTDSDTPMAGQFTVDATKVDATSEITSNPCDLYSATVSVAEPYAIGNSADSAQSIYLVLAPNQYEGTLTVTTNKAIYTYPYARTVARNRYYDVNIDLSKATSRQAIDSTWGGGDGSVSNPYIISRPSDITTLASLVNSTTDNAAYADKYYRQICDIDMTGIALPPIGATSTTPFKGHYDGGGFTISNAKITPAKSTLPCALIGYGVGAEVKNLTINSFTINSSAQYQAGIIGYAECCTVSGCTLEGTLNLYNLYSGGFVGYMEGGVVSHCRVDGRVENNVKGNNLTNESNVAYTAGFVGSACLDAIIEHCTLAGDVATMGRYAAGIVSRLENSVVRDCTVLNTAEISNVSHYCAGVVAIMIGNESHIERCRFEGRVNTSYPYAGAIVASITAGKVSDCISTRNSVVTSHCENSGGIVGQIYTSTASDVALIDHCAAYGQVEGGYNVGGIVGYVRHTVADAYAGVTNCAVLGSKLIAKGANSYGYNLVGGIAGWLHGNNKRVVIANCVARPEEIHAAPVSNKVQTKELISGLVACPNIDDIEIIGCYTDATRANTFWGFEPIAATTSGTVRHGAIFAYAYNSLSLTSCYYIDSMPMHGSYGSGKSVTTNSCSALTTTQMTDGTLLALLNEAATAYTPATNTPAALSWSADADGYPVPADIPVDTTPQSAMPKRVSVIGDSISTFRGYIPYAYSTYYPRADGTFLSVDDMYWYRLIYHHMTNARLERNIAYSGSWVTNASASVDTYFAKRFIDQNGVGNADIVIIHGGTNDWNKNVVELVDGLGIRSNSGPTDEQLAPLFTTADAATTRADIEALNDTTFCEAYIKLMKLIIERNPSVKIVCLIGDYLGSGVQQATHKMAAHFPDNARCVDLRAVGGFNDLDNNQAYMPKLYYDATSNPNQCHPNQKAMAFIAEKIYQELGGWLEN
ncbi:MAG: hypothetical protein IJX65_03650 [Alistipes sp.]|nr:hypothetical protein [Alistipes sp.]